MKRGRVDTERFGKTRKDRTEGNLGDGRVGMMLQAKVTPKNAADRTRDYGEGEGQELLNGAKMKSVGSGGGRHLHCGTGMKQHRMLELFILL
jgi:hypothetical protein